MCEGESLRLRRVLMNCCSLLLALAGCAGPEAQFTRDAENKQISPSSNSSQSDLTQVSIERKLLVPVPAVLNGSPVLIVGESEHLAQEGGTIGFCLEENKFRFEISLLAAEKAN